MDIGKIINHLSSRLRSRSQEVHTKLGIGNAQGKILNFILVESALHPVYQRDPRDGRTASAWNLRRRIEGIYTNNRKNAAEPGMQRTRLNIMNDNELMKSIPIPQSVAKMAIPSIISSLVTVVYNMADTFFVGQTGDPLQVAAVSLTNPIFILFMAFADMFGMGGSAAASIAMGENNKTRMKQVSSFITYASLGVSPLHAADPQHLRRKHGDS